MQPPAQTSSTWSVGSQGASQGSCASSGLPALPSQQHHAQHPPQQLAQKPANAPAPQARGDPVIRDVSADPFFTAQGPLSVDEYHWAVVSHLKSLKPSEAPASWVTRPIAPISAAAAEAGSSSTAGTSPAPGAAPTPTAASPTGESIRHPEPATSIEELRWRDYQALQQRRGGVAGPTIVPQQPQVPLPGAAAAATPAVAAAAGLPAPNTPVFPTPVRTLFPPTPPPAGGLPGDVGSGMDTSEAADLESQFKCIYVQPTAAIASPEEMRVVQVESYKTGKQITPYWLVSGA